MAEAKTTTTTATSIDGKDGCCLSQTIKKGQLSECPAEKSINYGCIVRLKHYHTMTLSRKRLDW